MRAIIFLSIGLLFTAFSGCQNIPEAYPPLAPGLSLSDSTVSFQHWNYALNPDYSIQPFTAQRTKTTKAFAVKIIENNYLKVTVLPGYGGRILSIFYKPTGHEQLYINPVGTPYGRGGGSFYYDWLMVYGGIFPTFPEPEHGKMWLRSWQCTVPTYNDDRISILMSITDSDEYASHPQKFDNGMTGLTCETTVSVYRDRPIVDFAIRLINPRSGQVAYEYWTCATLAPGSVPGQTVSPDNSRIIAPITQYEAGWCPNGWIGQPGSLYDYGNIDTLSKWTDMGIAYAANLTAPFWGVINEVNKEGILRIADNAMITPGLKFWTWGNAACTAIDPVTNSVDGRRPYIELWAGHSHAFFEDALINGNETKSWTETYFPTVGLEDVTTAGANGAAWLVAEVNGTDVEFTARYFTTWPDRNLEYTLELSGASTTVLATGAALANPAAATEILLTRPKSDFSAGSHSFRLTVKRADNGVDLLQAAVPLEL